MTAITTLLEMQANNCTPCPPPKNVPLLLSTSSPNVNGFQNSVTNAFRGQLATKWLLNMPQHFVSILCQQHSVIDSQDFQLIMAIGITI